MFIIGNRDPRWGRGQETPGEDPYPDMLEFCVVVEYSLFDNTKIPHRTVCITLRSSNARVQSCAAESVCML